MRKTLNKKPFIFIFIITINILIISFYINLINIGHWQDEYRAINLFHNWNWKNLSIWILSWSPRPISELFIFIYANIVQISNKTFITEFLALSWTIMISCVIIYPFIISNNSHLKKITLLISSSMLCLFLLGNQTGELFYWPQAAIAYIPVLSIITMTFWSILLINNEVTRLKLLGGIGVIAILSAEVGAFYFTFFYLIYFLTEQLSKKNNQQRQLYKWGILPIISLIIVYSLILHGRYESKTELFGDINVAHHIIPSIISSIYDFPKELFLSPNQSDLASSLKSVSSKLLLIISLFFLFREINNSSKIKNNKKLTISFSLSCFITSFFIIFASYYQFGTICCERHYSFRTFLNYMGIISFTYYLSTIKHSQTLDKENKLTLYAVVLFIATITSGNYIIDKAAYTINTYHLYKFWQEKNWSNGYSPQRDSSLCILPIHPITGGISIYGNYTFNEKINNASNSENWFPNSILFFFKKNEINFLPLHECNLILK